MAKLKQKTEQKELSEKVESFSIRRELFPYLLIWLKWTIKDVGGVNQNNTPLLLHGPEARARNRFTAPIDKEMKETDDFRNEILMKYAIKDKKGEFVTIPSTNPRSSEPEYTFTPENTVKKDLEIGALFNEIAIFNILPSNKEDFIIIKNLFLNKLRTEFSTDDSVIYEEICQSFEALTL